MTKLKFPSPRPRFRLKNYARFTAALLVFLLMITAVVVALGKISENSDSEAASIVVTPFVPPPTPEPTPPPIDVPEGKTVEKVIIVIDAGHGGSDPGTTSPYEDGFYEKEITLDIALKVRDYLTETGIPVIMTRESDVRLAESQREDLLLRAQLANDHNATLFVSIHVNAYDLKYPGARQVQGMEIFYYNPGKRQMFEDFDSYRFAEIMAKAIQAKNGIHYRGAIKNDLSVLRNTKMPAVLVETAYITNQEDHARLKSKEFRTNTAIGIAEGIKETLEVLQAFEYEGELYVFKKLDAE